MSTPSIPTNITGTWTIDPSHSQVGFTTRHAMVTKVRGSFNDFEGTVVVSDDEAEALGEAFITAPRRRRWRYRRCQTRRSPGPRSGRRPARGNGIRR